MLPHSFFPGSSAAHWTPLRLFWESGDSIHSVRSRTDRQKQKLSLHMSPAQKWPLGVINHDVHRCGHLETILPTVCSPQQALFTQVCSGTQLHSTQTNSLILNKWAIDFCLLSEQPEAFWTTIVSPILKKKKKSCNSRGNALSLLIIRFASHLSGPVPIFNLELLISTILLRPVPSDSGIFLAF